MKLSRKECRKYALANRVVDLHDGLLYTKQVKYIIQTAVRNIAGCRVLILYLILREQAVRGINAPRFTVFQGKDDYITLSIPERGGNKWLTASFENLREDGFIYAGCAFYTFEDLERVKKFCHKNNSSGMDALIALQENIRQKRYLKRRRCMEEKIVERLKEAPPLPRKLNGWIMKEIMPQYIFYNYQRKGKLSPGYCTACKKEVELADAKHNRTGICPHCKNKVIYKCRGRRGNLYARETIQVLQKTCREELVVRIIKACCFYPGKEEIPSVRIYENARFYFPCQKKERLSCEAFYDTYRKIILTSWKRGERPSFMYYVNNYEAETAGYLYTHDLQETLKNTQWEYSQMEEYYNYQTGRLDVVDYLVKYYKYPFLEYMIKLQLHRLADYIVGQADVLLGHNFTVKGKNLNEILGVEPKYIPLLQQLDVSMPQLEHIRGLLQNGFEPDKNLILWATENGITDNKCLSVPLRYFSAHKLMKYLQKQYDKKDAGKENDWSYGGINRAAVFYKDYLTMCEELKFNMGNPFVLFPKYLKKAHDNIMVLSEHKRKQKFKAVIAGMYKGLQKRYGFSRGELEIIAPWTMMEIIEEGQKLKHCVGEYIKLVAEGDSIILFLRKKTEIDRPLCTIEIKNNRIMQASCFDNDRPPQELKDFLEIWNKEVLQAALLPDAA